MPAKINTGRLAMANAINCLAFSERFYLVKISQSFFSISFIFSCLIFPTLYKTEELSAVVITEGITKLSCFKNPDAKSFFERKTKSSSSLLTVVICAKIIFSPLSFATTKAGLFLVSDKFVYGNGKTTISPFTNLSMLLHPLLKASFSQMLFHLLTLPSSRQLIFLFSLVSTLLCRRRR